MTPAETLAAARGNVVGPHIPATEALLTDWQGPARDGEWNVNVVVLESFGPTCLVYGTDPTGQDAEWELRVSRIRLDLRRPEVRDLLVRRGAPAWARDIAPALWVWAVMGKAPRFVLGAWDDCWSPRMDRWGVSPVNGVCLSTMSPEACSTLEDWSGWQFRIPSTSPQTGPETGPEGMACADVAALRAGCVLEESDGWLLPLPDGGIGFWPREVA